MDGPHSEAAHFEAPFETLLHLRFVPSIIILILSRCFLPSFLGHCSQQTPACPAGRQ